MRQLLFACVFAAMIGQDDAQAATKADSIVAFTGAHTKLIWKRFAWCNENYQPMTQAQAEANGYSLMLFDTDEGTERVVDKGLPDFTIMRISRSGKWAVYVPETTPACTYIIDLTSPNPVRKTLYQKSTCSYWFVSGMWVDPATNIEYTFNLDNWVGNPEYSGTAIYKVPLNSDGTADLSMAVKIKVNGTSKIDGALSVSADGTKLGGAFPWPNTMILDIATGNLTARHSGGFGCQANLAPDNSYRFFHCGSEHTDISMFPGLTGNYWVVDLNKNLAGIPSGTTTDFRAPRWSNHVQFLSNSYPEGDNGETYWDCNNSLCTWGYDATWVKTQLKQYMMPNFVLEKFSGDFKTVEKSMLIGSDPRYVQYGGDTWICSGVVSSGAACSSVGVSQRHRGSAHQTFVLSRKGSTVEVAGVDLDERSQVRIADSRGRIVYRWIGGRRCRFTTDTFAPGSYTMLLTTDGIRTTRELVITR